VIRLQSNLPWRRLGAGVVLLVLACAASGCVYRITVQQGNYLEKRNTDQLTPGMTKVQVRYLLGTPMMPSIFDNDRWDYLYYLKVGRKAPVQRQLTVFFKEDKVERIDNHGQEASTPDAPGMRVAAPAL
jgi:outer membrane protein assembly factor BamE